MITRKIYFSGIAAAAVTVAAGGLLVWQPDSALAQSLSVPSMRAPNIAPVSPRTEFRTSPGHGSTFNNNVYTTQSYTPPQRKVVRPAEKTETQAQRKTKSPEPSNNAPSGSARANTGAPPAGERRFVANEVVIEVPGSPTNAQADVLARRHNLTRVESQNFSLSGSTMFRWTVPDGRPVRDVIRGLEADNNIRSAQPNYTYTLQQNEAAALTKKDAEKDSAQYAVGKLRLSLAHGMATGDRVLVAVIDSGIDAKHPELDGVIADTFDPIGNGEPHAHGTGIAGTIAAQSRLMGVAPRARILAVRAFDPSGGGAEGTTFNILKGIEWAVLKGARVINMSFAGPQDPAMSRNIAAAHKKGVVMIAAAGNAGAKSPPLFPAADPNVIAVTATDSQDRIFTAANRGNHVAVAAPGVDILVPTPGASYQMSSGTSFAAGHVSGIAALIIERQGSLSPDSVRRILLSTAKDLGTKGRDRDFGMGLADAYQSVLAVDGRPADALSASATQNQ